jgi:hypothetical protein
MSDPMDLLCKARALRGLAEQIRTALPQEDQNTFHAYASVLDRDAERLEGEALTMVERLRQPLA